MKILTALFVTALLSSSSMAAEAPSKFLAEVVYENGQHMPVKAIAIGVAPDIVTCEVIAVQAMQEHKDDLQAVLDQGYSAHVYCFDVTKPGVININPTHPSKDESDKVHPGVDQEQLDKPRTAL